MSKGSQNESKSVTTRYAIYTEVIKTRKLGFANSGSKFNKMTGALTQGNGKVEYLMCRFSRRAKTITVKLTGQAFNSFRTKLLVDPYGLKEYK